MKTAILIAAVLLIPAQAPANWEILPSGLPNDRFEELLAFDDALYCTSYLGMVYTWHEATETWSLVGEGQRQTPGVSSLAISGDRAVLALVSWGETWRNMRTDGVWGTWQALPELGESIDELAFVGDRLFGARTSGLYVSDDLGSTWQLSTLPTTDSCDVVTLVNDVLLVHTNLSFLNDPGGEVFISGDFGLTWQNVSAQFPRARMSAICSHDGAIYTALNNSGPLDWIVSSADDGQTWTELAAYPEMFYIHALVSDSHRFFIGGYPESNTNLSIHYTSDFTHWSPYVDGLTNQRSPADQMVLIGDLLYKHGGGFVMRSPLPPVSAIGNEEFPSGPQATLTSHPNPFNPRATIEFEVPAGTRSPVVDVIDLRGRLLRSLPGPSGSASGRVVWDGLSNDGLAAASGAYLLRLRDGQRVLATRRVQLVR